MTKTMKNAWDIINEPIINEAERKSSVMIAHHNSAKTAIIEIDSELSALPSSTFAAYAAVWHPLRAAFWARMEAGEIVNGESIDQQLATALFRAGL